MSHHPPEPIPTRAILVTGPVSRHLVQLTTPMIWGVLAIMTFNFVDTWFVAQLGNEALAAMGFTFPVVTIMISIGIGMMAGTSSVIARSIGAGDHKQTQRVAVAAIALGLLISLIGTVIGLATQRMVFTALGARGATLELVLDYMTIWYAGFVVFLVPMIILGVIRATGDSLMQSRILVISAAVNLALDPLLIFGIGPVAGWGVQGAAAATVLARILSLVLGYLVLRKTDGILQFDPDCLQHLGASWRSLLSVALPAAGTNVVIPVAIGLVTAVVARYGDAAVAGFGAASRIEGLMLVVFYAMSAIIGPLVGQNLGAGELVRVEEALRIATRFCLALGAVIALFLLGAGEFLVGVFSADPQVIEVGHNYLMLVPVSYGAYGVVMVLSAALNGLGKPLPATVISVCRTAVIYVPAAYLLSEWRGLEWVFIAATLANLSGAVLAYRLAQRELARFKEKAP